jgi:murein L,D-transpeptidase YafK
MPSRRVPRQASFSGQTTMGSNFSLSRFGAVTLTVAGSGLLAGCQEPGTSTSASRATASIPPTTLALMSAKGTSKNAPVLIRAYKKESELEIWKMKPDGRYTHLKTFPMCRWSGQLGPKAREGDRQVPEGFYSITRSQMNPNSAYYLSFNVGYPNSYDRAMGRTGGAIMVHGACSSAGCFSMTDDQIAEIYAIAREGFAGGQRAIQMQSYPFRMTAENLAKYRLDPNIGFWKQLKEGSDNFEVTKKDVAVNVCNRRYVFNVAAADGSSFDPSGTCPPLMRNESVQKEVASRQKRDELKIAELATQGVRPMRTVYADGGQHPNFKSRMFNVSRPEALVQAPIEVALDDSKAKKSASSPLVQLASVKPPQKPATPSDTKPNAATDAEPSKEQSSIFSGWWFGSKDEADSKPEPAPVVAQGPVVETPAPARRRSETTAAKAAPGADSITGAAKVVPTGFSTTKNAAH